jgi:hypothetical protein
MDPNGKKAKGGPYPAKTVGVCEQFSTLALMTWMQKKMNGWPVKKTSPLE